MSKRVVQFVLATAGAFALGTAIDAVNTARLKAATSQDGIYSANTHYLLQSGWIGGGARVRSRGVQVRWLAGNRTPTARIHSW